MHRSKWALSFTFVLSVAFAITVTGTGVADEPALSVSEASGGSSAEVAAPEIADSMSEAELQDLQAVADQLGISPREAIDRYAWNDNLSLAVAQIREKFPQSFAGAEIVDAGNAWVMFTGRPPAEALAILDTFSEHHANVAIEVREGAGFSEVELQQAIERVHYAVFTRPEVIDASTTHDYATNVITTRVVLIDGAPESAIDNLRVVAIEGLAHALPESVGAALSAEVVKFAGPRIHLDESSSHHMGGEDITGCTSGFGTRASSHTSGTRGISTAGHCANAQTDDGWSLTHQGGHEGTHGDFQWHTGPQIENDQFYAGNSTSTEVNERDVASIGSPMAAQTLCRNGITSKRDCQEVRKLNVCAGGECNLVQMGSHLSAGGDSGGPIYWANTAYGLHKGMMYDPFWPYGREVFSRADRIDNALGIYIATN